jgi:glycosyltransferase involved in cell wall biosynthesis
MAETGKIQVLQIVENLAIGGMERIIQSLAAGLPKEKYQVRVWCLTKGGAIAEELKSAGIEVEILAMGPRCTLPFLLKLKNKIKDSRIDILHAHGYAAATIGRTAGFLAGVPVLLSHMHSTYWEYGKKKLLVEKALSLVTDKIICCSSAVAAFVVHSEKVSPRKAVVVYNGAADMRGGDGAAFRAANGLSPEDFVIGLPASLVLHKGQSYFLEAFKDIVKECPAARVVLAGDGPLKKELEELSGRLGVRKKVNFSGVLGEMGGFFAAADLVVLSSTEREGISVAILEAMSAGKAVVGTRVGGIPEAVANGETGVLVPPWDSPALAAAVLGLIRDRNKLAEMGRAGRSRYEKKFTRERMMAEICGIYDELLAK